MFVAMILAAAVAGAAPAEAAMPLEDAVLAEINHVRANPRAYAEELRRYRAQFRGQIVYTATEPNGIISNEGVAAVDEAIDFLERQAPLPPLGHGELLMLAAQDHADDQGAIGAFGHFSRDGANPGERVRRRGGGIYVGETIAYGLRDAEGVVRGFIVDDGVPDRGHRNLIFTPTYKFAGVGCGKHAVYRVICVVDYAGTQDGQPDLAGMPRNASTFVYRGSRGGGAVASAR